MSPHPVRRRVLIVLCLFLVPFLGAEIHAEAPAQAEEAVAGEDKENAPAKKKSKKNQKKNKKSAEKKSSKKGKKGKKKPEKPDDRPPMIILDRVIEQRVLEKAYAKLAMGYAVKRSSKELVPLSKVKGKVLSGKVVDLEGGKKVIVESGGGISCVILRRGFAGKVGDDVKLVIRLAGSPKFSYETKASTRKSIPQYYDLTMSYEDFISYLRGGYHFPSCPELGTQPKMKGLFKTRTSKIKKAKR